MTNRLTQDDIAELRVIDRFECSKRNGVITTGRGQTFNIAFDDIYDLYQAIEALNLRLTRKLLAKKCRPTITKRKALKASRIAAGPDVMYEGDDAPETGGHYLLVEIDGTVWHSWFRRLDELMKCLTNIITEAQIDAYEAPIREVVLQ